MFGKVYVGEKDLADKQTLWFVYMHLTDLISIPILGNLMTHKHKRGPHHFQLSLWTWPQYWTKSHDGSVTCSSLQ